MRGICQSISMLSLFALLLTTGDVGVSFVLFVLCDSICALSTWQQATHTYTPTHTHTYTQHVTNCIVSIRISSCLSLCVPFSCWALSAAYLKLSFATLACTWIYLFMNFEGRQAAFSASASASASSSSSSSHFIFFIISAFTYWFTSSYICSPVSCSHTHTHTHSSWAP